MYSQASWGGSVNPFILTKIENSTEPAAKDALVSFVIYEWRDADLLGITRTSNGLITVSIGRNLKKEKHS